MLRSIEPPIEHYWWGLTDFNQIESLQMAQKEEAIWGGEFFPVVTLGRRVSTGTYSEMNLPHWPAVMTQRGGLVTLHSPGQLVIYPLIHLRQRRWGVADFVQNLLQTTQRVLLKYKLETVISRSQPGLYTTTGKIAYCGLKIQDGLSRYGLAINVCNVTSSFKKIESCGLKNSQTDSLLQQKVHISTEELFKVWCDQFWIHIEENGQELYRSNEILL